MDRYDFNNIIHDNYRKIYQLAYRMLNNKQEAEDIVQEVFLKLWKMKMQLDEYNNAGALAMTITRNYCIDVLRKRMVQARNDELSLAGTNVHEPSPHDHFVRSEDKILIRHLVSQLPENMRDVIRMHDIQQLTYDEMSELTGNNINSLRVLVSRARKMIREQYIKHSYERRGDKAITG